MKCVKEGNKHQEVYTATCKKCASVFEEEKDKLKTCNSPFEGPVIQTVHCPVCDYYGLSFKSKL